METREQTDITLCNGTAFVRFPNEVSTSNAHEVQKSIDDALTGKTVERIVLDASDLRYISSMGLRIILMLKKKYADLAVENVSPEVYGIFDMTGYTQIMTVHRALKIIDVSGCEVIGRGGVGTIYRLNGECIAKVFNPGFPLEAVEAEMDFTKNAFVAGISTMMSFQIARCGEQYAAIYELLNNGNLTNYILKNPDRKAELVKKYARFVREMDDIELDTKVFPSVKRKLLNMISQTESLCTAGETGLYLRMINAVPDSDGFVHGDCHMKNVIYDGSEFIMIDFTDGGFGNRIFELMALCRDYKLPGYPLFSQGIPEGVLETVLGFSPEECPVIWNTFFAEYMKDEPDAAEIEKMVETYSLLLNLLDGMIYPGIATPELIAEQKRMVKEDTDRNFDRYCELLKKL